MTCNKENLSSNSCLSDCFFEMGSLKRKRPPKIQIPDVLKEIKIDARFNFGGSPAKDDVVSCFGDLGVGFSSIKGKKKFMEDTHKIVSSINGDPKKVE